MATRNRTRLPSTPMARHRTDSQIGRSPGYGNTTGPRQVMIESRQLEIPARCGWTSPHARIPMRITWYGHAAFLIETQGLRIILDPYRSPDSGGYEPIAEPADLVVVSHENDRYHSHLGQIVPPFETIRALELPPDGEPVPRHPDSVDPCLRDPRAAAGRRGDDRPFSLGGPARRLPGRPRPSPVRSGAGAAPGCRHRPGGRGRPADDRLSRHSPLCSMRSDHGSSCRCTYKTPKINLNIQPLERFLEVLPGDPVERPGPARSKSSRATLPVARTIVGPGACAVASTGSRCSDSRFPVQSDPFRTLASRI